MDKLESIHIKVMRLYQAPNVPRHHILWQMLMRHCVAIKNSWQSLWRNAWTTFTTVAALGLLLLLALLLHLGLQSLAAVSDNWDKGTRITLYLHATANAASIHDVLAKIRSNSNVAKAQYISAAAGLRELQSHLGQSLEQLRANPLPPVVIVTPKFLPDAASVMAVLAELEQLPAVEKAQLDMAWVKRLYYFVDLGERISIALFVIFGLGIILSISHVSKKTVQAMQQETMLLRLFGASSAMIRLPFLYGGMWYGLLSGLCALFFTQLVWWWISSPFLKLIHSYGSVAWRGLDFITGLFVVLCSMFLGVLGALLALAQHQHEHRN